MQPDILLSIIHDKQQEIIALRSELARLQQQLAEEAQDDGK